MKHRNLWLLVAGLLMVLAAPAFADTGGYDVGNIMDKYQTAAQQFGTAISGAALSVCFTLFTIDLLWTVLGKLTIKATPLKSAWRSSSASCGWAWSCG